MAFTASQQSSIRFYLGYSDLDDNGPLQRAIDTVGDRATAVPLITAELQRCVDIDTQLLKAYTTALAITDGSIQLRVHYQIAALARLGRQAVGRIASFLSAPVHHDVFSGAGPNLPSSSNADSIPDGAWAPSSC
jgi:hypothetical protein